MMMRVTLPYQPSSSFTAASELAISAANASCSFRSRGRCTIVCAIPARDVVIDFGKFKGSKMGTLPSSYLRWLIRESTHSRLAVWGDYAKQVLLDPHYLDRLEWESIEKLAVRGDMRKGGPPIGSAGVKGSMQALGWDLSDHSAWSQVNFSLLGTSLGGRIPRKKLDPSVSSPNPAVSKPGATISNPKRAKANPNLASGMSAVEASTADGVTISSSAKNPASKSYLLGSATDKQDAKVKTRPSQSLSLQEELLRRRQLRKEQSIAKTLKMLPPMTKNAGALFPGRESLLKKAKDRADK